MFQQVDQDVKIIKSDYKFLMVLLITFNDRYLKFSLCVIE